MDTSHKTLAVAVDLIDNLAGHDPSPKRMYTPEEAVRMIDYFHQIGVGRLYWMDDAWNALYEKPFGGTENLLAFACDEAHKREMTVHSVIKPFETGLHILSVPLHLRPSPRSTRSIQGWHPLSAQFTADHPEMLLAYRNLPEDCAGPERVQRIRLVGSDTNSSLITHADIEILWSGTNSMYQTYDGPMTCSESEDDNSRVLEWTGLELPAEARYIMLRYSGDNDSGDFSNRADLLLELHGPNGKLPSQHDQGLVPIRAATMLASGNPFPEETRAVLEDPKQCEKAFENHFVFDRSTGIGRRAMNVPGGYICHTLDNNTHCAGGLHPCYPEVRAFWLDWVRRSLDAGADGVGLRIANHSTRTGRPEDLGFNEPVLKEYCRRTGKTADPGETDFALIRSINGEFYTKFVRECSEMVRGRGCRMQHFVHPLMDGLWTRPNTINNVPATFEFDYRSWLREGLLDGLCLRPHWKDLNDVRYFGDMVGAQARLFGVDMFYANQTGPLNKAASDNEIGVHIPAELNHVRNSDLYDGFILYEAAGVMGFDESGTMHTSERLEQAIDKNWR